METRKGIWLVTMVCVFLGFFTVRAFDKNQTGVEIGEVASLKKIQDLVNQKKALEEKKHRLDLVISEQEAAISRFEDAAADKSILMQDTQKDLKNARLMAGLLPLKGPGIEIILNDRKRETILSNNPFMIKYFIVHDSDMLNVINELRGAGAEAIAINGTRIMGTSRISCGGPTINVGKYERFAPPFIIHAIGNPDDLIANFYKEDSIYNDLIAWGLEFQIKKVDNIEIPRYLGDMEYSYAKFVKEGE